MDDLEHERLGLIDAIKNLAALIEQSRNIQEVYRYADQLSELKARLVALGPPPANGKRRQKS